MEYQDSTVYYDVEVHAIYTYFSNTYQTIKEIIYF